MSAAPGWELVSSDRLTGQQQRAVLDLAADVAIVDGAPPLNEDAVLHLSTSAPDRHQRLIAATGELLGYAQLRDDPAGTAAEMAVAATDTDRAPVAAALFEAAEAVGAVLVWSHAEASPVGSTARHRGYLEDRVLLAMSRPLTAADAELDVTPLPGVTVRAFEPGRDEADWVAVNARAFAEHPEQGRWTARDLAERMSQPWFDPAGFFLAFSTGVDTADKPSPSGGGLLGFHWTKIEAADRPAVGRSARGAGGEVYVIGLDPHAQGRGLGGLLLRTGLRHLARAGLSTVVLYTDESNSGAVALYHRTGFEVIRREVRFRRPAPAQPGTGPPGTD